ncbi:substrate-binding domain-containing protein [Rhodobacter calidifons]|uniref:Substrate-binding domain-containing protein n=1 Tax=Rhodobacter calidifons TaxID=2715277 RepID=A0ABX0G9L3_9RHOB|nr:substrate-binding domain-containing protein [Rhodobacter calidifons]NHB77936.1 substrate-binding domain-containing protein [Rhodobacter calidifons]
MGKRPTIIDVATLAGVSRSTVSLVLQHSPLVREETREEVRRAMARPGHVCNRAAANLRRANAGLIGLVINDLRTPFFTEFATSLQMALSARGHATVLANTDEDPARQARVAGAMPEHGVSALIVSPAQGEDSAFEAILRARVPVLQVLRQVVPSARVPFAAPDCPTGSRLATEHLLARGARHIASVGGLEGRAVTQLRMSGHVETLAARGLTPLHLPGRPCRPGQGRAVGPGLRIAGFDDIEDCAQVFPALSPVRCDIAGFGRQMAETVLDWLENDRRPPARTVTPVTLIPRASSL